MSWPPEIDLAGSIFSILFAVLVLVAFVVAVRITRSTLGGIILSGLFGGMLYALGRAIGWI